MKMLKSKFCVFVLILIVLTANVLSFGLFEKEREFEVDNILLKTSIEQGDSLTKNLIVKNLGEETLELKVESNTAFISVDKIELSLLRGEAKDLMIHFDVEDKEPGVYLGKLILSGNQELEVPIIVEIETKELLFDNNIEIPVEYVRTYPGGKVVIENKIFNLENINAGRIEVNYIVMDFSGKTILSEKENVAVENQIITTKVASIPEDSKLGDYLAITIVKYGDSVGTSTYFFKVVKKDSTFTWDNFYIWIVFILFLVVILFMVYSSRQKDKFLLALAEQHKNQLKKESETLQKKKAELKKLSPRKRKVRFKILCKIRQKRRKVIEKIYRSRVRIVKKLRKKKKQSEVQEKLAEWGKQGYNVKEFSIDSEKPKNLKNYAHDLKKQGFKF